MADKSLNKDKFRKRYNDIFEYYERLGNNLTNDLRELLQEHKLDVLDIYTRTKSFKSFWDKIQIKKYDDPLEDIEDICGVRIIYFYLSDLEQISQIIEKEFEILEVVDKKAELGESAFGYRDKHYIVKIKKSWEAVPGYRKLIGLKAEIQLRTILMHAWDDIEHKLAYKTEEDIPTEFRRNLFRISASLEDTDEQFDRLRIERTNYIDNIKDKATKDNAFDQSLDLNLDNLQAFLDYFFPDLISDAQSTSDLYRQLIIYDYKFTIKELVDSALKFLPILSEVEAEISSGADWDHWQQTGATRFSLYIFSDEYLAYTRASLPDDVVKIIEKWQT